MFFDKFKGGIFTVIKKKDECSFYYGENSWWIIDDWESDILNKKYFETIEQLKVEFKELEDGYVKNCLDADNFCFDWLPSLYVDFDSEIIYNNYYDQALENRLIEGWEGVFIESKSDFLAVIPIKYNYWRMKQDCL